MEESINNNSYRALVSDIFIFIIGTVLAKVIQFLLMPLYTTYMTTQAYGIAELTNNLAELFFPVVTLCIYEAAFRFAVDEKFDNKRLATAVLKVMLYSIMYGMLIAICSKFIFHYEYAFYLYFILYAYSIRMCAAYFVRGKGFSKIFAMSGVVNALGLSIFNVIFLVILDTKESGYLVSIGLSYTLSAIYLIIKGRINDDLTLGIDSSDDLRILFRYSIPLIFYNVLYWFTTISGRYVLLLFTDSSTTGKYVAAIKIAAVVNMVQQAVYSAFQLNSSRIFMEKNKEVYYSNIINSFIALYCTFGSIVICFTPTLARITLKNEFYDARLFLPIIMLAAIMNCVSSLLGTMYSTYKKTKRMVGVSIIGAVINIFACLLLTPIWGIWGVCISSVLCYYGQVIYKFIDVRLFCNIKYNWNIVLPNFVILALQVIMMSTIKKSDSLLTFSYTFILVILNIKSLLFVFNKLVSR